MGPADTHLILRLAFADTPARKSHPPPQTLTFGGFPGIQSYLTTQFQPTSRAKWRLTSRGTEF